MLNSIPMLLGVPVNVKLNTYVIGGTCKCRTQYTCYLGCLSMLKSVHMLMGMPVNVEIDKHVIGDACQC